MTDSPPQNPRHAFTLLEVMVVVAVIGILCTIVLPAVQASRAAASRVHCVNNLKQLSIAIQSYSASHGYFPPIVSPIGGRGVAGSNPYRSAHSLSPIVRVLADLDLSPLYNSVNFSLIPHIDAGLYSNLTAMKTTLGIATCPSDSNPSVPGFGRCNYRFSVGPTHRLSPSLVDSMSWMGPFTCHLTHTPAAFTDGLSNTIGLSERCQGDWIKGTFKRGGDYLLAKPPGPPLPTSQAVVDWCMAQQPADWLVESRGGESWFLTGFHFTSYNHLLPPNPMTADCSTSSGSSEIWERATLAGVFSATSMHPGGVNCALMDGSVRFIRGTISQPVWHSYATRNGGEPALPLGD